MAIHLAATSSTQDKVYTVKRGDSLTAIAQKLNFCLTNRTIEGARVCLGAAKRIAEYNGIKDIAKIYPRQVLRIPEDTANAPVASEAEVRAAADVARHTGQVASETTDLPLEPVGPGAPPSIRPSSPPAPEVQPAKAKSSTGTIIALLGLGLVGVVTLGGSAYFRR